MNLRRNVLHVVREQFRLEWLGIHGVPHWARVRWNALAMARDPVLFERAYRWSVR